MKKNYIILSFLFLIGQTVLALPMNDDCNVDVIFKNVGQGNCTILRSRVRGRSRSQPDRYEICIFDIGTSRAPKDVPLPQHNGNVVQQAYPAGGPRILLEDLADNIRDDLQDAISITVVLSHPDRDHNSLFRRVFNEIQGYQRFHVVIGGNPINYSETFRIAVRNCFHQGARIYFPSVNIWHDNVNSNVGQLNQTFQTNLDRVCNEDDAAGINIPAILSRYADPNNPNNYITEDNDQNPILLFDNAFHFAYDNLRVACLGVNPTHFTRNGYTSRMHNLDDNADSLVFKIQYGQSSVMITGDASVDTTETIRGNYSNNLNFLHASVYLASHHGSLEKGGNHPCFLAHVQPECIAVSHGDRYHHPRHIAINRLNFHNTLMQVAPHYFYYNTRQGNAINCFYTSTDRKIFSTMGGDVTVELHQNGNINLEQEGVQY